MKNRVLYISLLFCISCTTLPRTPLFVSPIHKTPSQKFLLLTPNIYIRSVWFDQPYKVGADSIRAVSLRKVLMKSFEDLSKGKIEYEEYYCQNQPFNNDLYWFMQNAATKVLDTAYLAKKKFDTSHLRKQTVVIQLTHLSNYYESSNSDIRKFLLCVQVLSLNEQNHIAFYNLNYEYVTDYDNLDATLPQQLALVLKPFFDSLEKNK